MRRNEPRRKATQHDHMTTSLRGRGGTDAAAERPVDPPHLDTDLLEGVVRGAARLRLRGRFCGNRQ